MSIILNIDTSIEIASVSIAKDGVIITSVNNPVQKEHAGFLHLAIQDLLVQSSTQIKQIDAIAVTKGPGSYTGLRVGMAAAKGLCYALNIPFITIGTLDALAVAAKNEAASSSHYNLFCPMIDARRMEVYTAVFDTDMNEILTPCAMVLGNNSFGDLLQRNNILFIGSGAHKWSNLVESVNASFLSKIDITTAISNLSYDKFKHKDFTDLSYSEPLYVKDFFST